jgi:hypothetical protein
VTKTVAWPCTLASSIHNSGWGESARRERARVGARARGACGARRAEQVECFLYVVGSMHPGRPNALNNALSLGEKKVIDALIVLSSLLVLS